MTKAQLIDTLAQRYHCIPSAILQEPADLLFHMAALLSEVAPVSDDPGGQPGDMGSYRSGSELPPYDDFGKQRMKPLGVE